jgi:hypothetical protein
MWYTSQKASLHIHRAGFSADCNYRVELCMRKHKTDEGLQDWLTPDGGEG